MRFFGLHLGLCLALGACSENPPAWNASKEELLEQEVCLAPDHPWAGVYWSCPMLNCWERLVLSPSGRFSYHGSCCVVTDERQGGDVRLEDRRLVLRSDVPVEGAGFRPEPGYWLVPWGEFRFLIELEDMGRFVSCIRNIQRNGSWVASFLSTRSRADTTPLEGLPELPAPWAERAAGQVLDAICLSARNLPESGGWGTVEVVLDQGSEQGAWPAMVLWGTTLQEQAVITTVRENTSTAEIRYRTLGESIEGLTGERFSEINAW